MIETGIMMRSLMAAGFLMVFSVQGHGAPDPVAHWRLDQIQDGRMNDASGARSGHIQGSPQIAPGAVDGSLKFDGEKDFVRVENTEGLSFPDATFSLALWVNVYHLGRGEQMLVGKNDYNGNKREWGLTMRADNRFRLYLHDGNRWTFVESKSTPQPGQWHHVGVSVSAGFARLYVDGILEAERQLSGSVPATDAPVTFGASYSGGKVMQPFLGALDDIQIFSTALAGSEFTRMAGIAPPAPHIVPDLPFTTLSTIHTTEVVGLWSLPNMEDLKPVEGVTFHAIKANEPEVDGMNWLHGVGLMWHKDKLYASFGHNEGHENTAGEMANYRVSEDGGKTWGPVKNIDKTEGNRAVSHGVFHSHNDTLWAFHGAFYDRFQRTHTRAYKLDEATDTWNYVGEVAGDGFWALQQPERMEDGNWIMAGARVRNGFPGEGMEGGFHNLPAVAISHGDDFTKWDMVVVPLVDEKLLHNLWGEANVIVNGAHITIISRWNQLAPFALIAESRDYGRTWTKLRPSTMPMAASKPCTGMLSTGQRYLISNSSGDNGNRRVPLTIVYSRPGQKALTQIRVIRHGNQPDAPWNGGLSYPCAIEHDGMLYVGYSNSGGRRGGNRNNAEMAVLPIDQLR